MFKFYRDFVDNVLILLTYLNHQDGRTLPECHQYVGGIRTLPDRSKVRVREALANGAGNMDGGFYGMEDLILKQMASQQQKQMTGDLDLVEKIVYALQLPYVRNSLTGRTLDQLRKAILLPEERAGLLNRLEQKELMCGECGHVFENGEMVTVNKEGTRMTTFYCVKCVLPTFTACMKCEGHAEIPKSIRKKLSEGFECEGHHGEAPGPVIQQPRGTTVPDAMVVNMENLEVAAMPAAPTVTVAGNENMQGIFGVDTVLMPPTTPVWDTNLAGRHAPPTPQRNMARTMRNMIEEEQRLRAGAAAHARLEQQLRQATQPQWILTEPERDPE